MLGGYVMEDVIIIGAGPAGSTAARLLAQSGKQVLVLEQATFPRKKPCGGAITSRAVPLLPDQFMNHVLSSPTAWTFRGKKGSRTLKTSKPFCYTVDRSQFDHWLAQEAQKAGAQVMFNTPVTALAFDGEQYIVKTSHRYYYSRYLIGADGAKGVTAKYLGLTRPHNGAAVETEIPFPSSLLDHSKDLVEIDVSRYPWGYAWIIPHGSIANIGVGSFKASKLPSLKGLLQDYIMASFPGASALDTIWAHPLPYRVHFSSLAIDHAVLVGDAAGLMDSFSAEGIFSALYSAHIASEAINIAYQHHSGTESYNARIREDFWTHLRPAIKMSHLFYPLAGFWTEWFLHHTELLEEYLALTQGESTYDQLLAKTQATLLAKLHIRPLTR
ncbi:geranylgeranyl reductase family protein [Sulfobacillus thermosulfidooxidans]|nr:geranylgeranyl reductase family protein [Sulfobacillus thermosulfidooxidans]